VESLERFTQNQRIIEEFVAQWLAHQPCTMARLAHVATLRDTYTGLYGHVILEQSSSKGAVHESLLYCHEELFEKIRECSFPEPECDLRRGSENRGIPAAEIARRWLETELFRGLVRYGTPRQLGDLFTSHLRVILGSIASQRDWVHPSA
jgi:hypothetical protein